MKNIFTIILLVLFSTLLIGQDTIVNYSKIMDLHYDLKDSRYFYSKKIIPTPDGGSLIYFTEDRYDGNYKTYLVKIDECSQVQWTKEIPIDNNSIIITIYSAYIKPNTNVAVLLSKYDYKTSYGEIFEVDLDSGDIYKRKRYPEEREAGYIFRFRKVGKYNYFTNLSDRSFMRTDTDFVENLYCQSRDTVLDNWGLVSRFYLTDSNAVSIINKYRYINGKSVKYNHIEVLDLSCNRLWDKIFYTKYSPNYLISNHSIYIFNEDSIKIYDMQGNMVMNKKLDVKSTAYEWKFDVDMDRETYKTIPYFAEKNKKIIVTKSFAQDTLEVVPYEGDLGRLQSMYSIGDSAYVFFSKKYENQTFTVYTGKLKYNDRTGKFEFGKCIISKTNEVDNEKVVPFVYYPNPVISKFVVKSKEGNAPIEHLSIKNIRGDKVLEYSYPFYEKNINIENFTSGVYLLTVTINGNVYYRKIIKT